MRFVCIVGLLLLCGCTAPFSDFQSASTVGAGEAELTANYSSVTTSDGKLQDQAGCQVGFGLTDNVDMRGRYEYVWFGSDDTYHANVVGFGPKFSLKKDHAAFYVPVGFAFGDNIESDKTWEIHPTLILTQALNSRFEVNFSMKTLMDLSDEGRGARFAFNLGLGIGPEVTWLILRPELGIMVSSQGGDPLYHFGIGASLMTDGQRRID